MPRLPRIQVEGAVYYVTSKGSQNQHLFIEAADYKTYLDLLAKYKTQHKFKLFSYSLLPNKIHLLIEPSDEAKISDIMHDLNSLYTKHYNGHYGRHGHLFESRFKSILVEKKDHLLPVTRHVHRSPLQSLAASADLAQGIENYPYSSLGTYSSATASQIPMREEIDEVLGFLKDGGVDAYTQYCKRENEGEDFELEKKLRRGSILGSDAFVEQVKNRLQEYSETQKEELLPKSEVKRATRKNIFFAVAAVMAVAALATYLFVSKNELQSQYQELLRQKEMAYKEGARFENRNPLALSDLEGTVWDIDLIAKQGEVVKDKISFVNGRFTSEYFEARGLRSSKYFLVPQGSGLVIWQSAQSNPKGESVSWRGEWKGDVMKGSLTIYLTGKSQQEFTFFSNGWSYQNIVSVSLEDTKGAVS